MLSAKQLSVLVVLLIALVAVGGASGNLIDIDPEQQFFGSDTTSEPADSIAVVDVSQTAQVRADNSFQIVATVKNMDSNERTRPVALKIDATGDGELATTVAVENVTTPGDGSNDVEFTVPADTLDKGTYTYGVVAGDVDASPNATSDVTINQPPMSRLSETATVDTVVAGENATVVTTVENVGDYAGTHRLRLGIDSDHDGSIQANEKETVRAVTIEAGGASDVEFTVPTDGLEPDRYDYHVFTDDASAEGTLVVKQPATYRINAVDGPINVSRGEVANISVTVANEGDIDGNQTVSVTGANGTVNTTREVRIANGASRTLEFTANTTNLTRGNYSIDVSTDDDNTSVPVRVRESHFLVGDLTGTDTITIGDELSFTATVTNVGDANETQAIEYKLDRDGDDVPEGAGITWNVTLAPGESRDVTVTVPDTEDPGQQTSFEPVPPGTHVHGVYSHDANVTDVLVAERDSTDDGSSSRGDDSSTDTEIVSRDEISQQKYGLYYDQISSETQAQVDELFSRQPFADDLDVTEVLTREEIARQEYGLDVKRNDNFDFSSIDVETQQEIEADFDAQFESQKGDRVESWDELAQDRYGSDYDQLSEDQQQNIRKTYQDQL